MLVKSEPSREITYFEEIRHPHWQDDGLLKKSLGFVKISYIIPSYIGVLLYNISFWKNNIALELDIGIIQTYFKY